MVETLISDPNERFLASVGGDPCQHAFPSRPLVMPWRSYRPIPPDDIPVRYEQLMLEPAKSPRGRVAYLHVPFCANRCAYCGFYQNPYRTEAGRDYAATVREELLLERGAPRVKAHPVSAIYFGGGTPTGLEAEDLARLLRSARAALPVASDVEVTVEARVLGFDEARLDACLEAGANRFSFGVQSFDTEVRRAQGRRASRPEVMRVLGGLLATDRAPLILDLMFGLPGQTLEVWRQDLAACLELGPDGVDLYALNVFPSSPLGRRLAEGRGMAAATVAEQGDMYREGVETLLAAGWTQISNSHFARTTRERNRYNLLVKEGAETLAFGAGAGGHLGGVSFRTEGALDAYASSVRAGRKAIAGMAVADRFEPLRRFVGGGLERGRLELGARVPMEAEETRSLWALVEQWQQAGLLDVGSRGVLQLRTAGRFWAPNLVAGLVALLSALDGLDFEAT